MARVTTGNPTPYSPADSDSLEALLADEFEQLDGAATPTSVTVEATIEWAGSYNPHPHRKTTLTNLDLTEVRAAAARNRARVERARAAYPAKGWHAQLRELTRTAQGEAAADRAGLSPTRRTLIGWLTGETTPTRANRERIERAYAAMRNDRVAAARAQGRGSLEKAFTQALRDEYGREIRLFQITDFRIR